MAPRKDSCDTGDTAPAEFERQMAAAREVMDKRWVALRALALSDQHPELDVHEVLRMAEEQARHR
jgi:hypothetical protein